MQPRWVEGPASKEAETAQHRCRPSLLLFTLCVGLLTVVALALRMLALRMLALLLALMVARINALDITPIATLIITLIITPIATPIATPIITPILTPILTLIITPSGVALCINWIRILVSVLTAIRLSRIRPPSRKQRLRTPAALSRRRPFNVSRHALEQLASAGAIPSAPYEGHRRVELA